MPGLAGATARLPLSLQQGQGRDPGGWQELVEGIKAIQGPQHPDYRDEAGIGTPLGIENRIPIEPSLRRDLFDGKIVMETVRFQPSAHHPRELIV